MKARSLISPRGRTHYAAWLSVWCSLVLVCGGAVALTGRNATAQANLCPTIGFEVASSRTLSDGATRTFGQPVAADFNGDGLLDLAAPSGNEVALFFNDGAGGFGRPGYVNPGARIAQVAVGDCNGDGRPDLLVVNEVGNQLILMTNLGAGLFRLFNTMTLAPSPQQLLAEDCNGDGLVDLIARSYYAPQVAVWLNRGEGLFTAPAIINLTDRPIAMVAADFDGSGRPDLAVMLRGGRIALLHNNGGGGFTLAIEINAPSNTSQLGLVAGRFDADGRLDLMVKDGLLLSLLRNAGTHNFIAQPALQLDAATASRELRAADCNGDGRTDLLLGDTGTASAVGQVSLLINQNGQGEPGKQDSDVFKPPAEFVLGRGALQAFAAVDCTNDGRADLVGLNSLGGTNPTLNWALAKPTSGFAAQSQYALPNRQTGMVAGDVNGDGRSDLVTLVSQPQGSADSVATLLADEAGRLQSPRLSDTGGGGARAVALADLDHDGRLDAIVSHDAPGRITVLSGDGAGGFAVAQTYVLPDAGAPLLSSLLATVDCNGDGFADLIVGLRPNEVVVLLNDGRGGLSAARRYSLGTAASFSHGPSVFAAGDFNGDGRLDLAIASAGATSVIILRGRGDGLFDLAVTLARNRAPLALVATDFNGDGRSDLAIGNAGSGSYNEVGVSILLGNADGSFLTRENVGGALTASALAAGDYNGDGRIDLAGLAVAPERDAAFVLLGNGAGGFSAPTPYPLAGDSAWFGRNIITGEFNGDGRADLAFTNARGVSLLLNATDCRALNTPPRITPLGALTAQQGSVFASAPIARVSDDETPKEWLAVSLAGLPAGVTVAGVYNPDGFVRVQLAVACDAALGRHTFELRLNDGGGAITTANLSLTITANTPPELSVYPPALVGLGRSATLQPPEQPRDNGAVTQLTLTASASFTGALSIDPSNGFMIVSNAGPPGAHTLTVTATDNCGATTRRSFLLNVVDPAPLVTLSVAPGPYTAGQSLALTAVVRANAPDAPQPAGTVRFYDGETLLGAATLNASQQATFALNALTPGARRLTAVYSGDGFYQTASSSAVTLTVPAALANVSAANYQSAVFAPEQLVTAFGDRLAIETRGAVTPTLSTVLAGTRVTVTDSSGVERAAPLLFVAPTQINYVMPAGLAEGQARVAITSADGSVAAALVRIARVAPGIFTCDASGNGLAAAQVLRVRADGTRTFEPVARFDPAQARFVAAPIDFGAPSDQLFLLLYATGLRQRSILSAVQASIGDMRLDVLFAGAQPTLAGLDQINLVLPRSLSGRGAVEVVVTVDGRSANPVKLVFQ